MLEIITLLSIGIALSMDTFSLSLGLGTFNISNKKALLLSCIVGLMHFIMPFIGVILGQNLINLFKLDSNFLLGLILIAISFEMLFDLLKKEERNFNLSFIGMFLFALGVSIDSFSVGLGIRAITDNQILAMIIFALSSFIFTFGGILIGKCANKLLGTYANILGVIILFVLGLVHLI